jgi:hypothetical protein
VKTLTARDVVPWTEPAEQATSETSKSTSRFHFIPWYALYDQSSTPNTVWGPARVVTVRGPTAPWAQSVKDELEAAMALEASWDSYGGLPIVLRHAREAVNFLNRVMAWETRAPWVVPVPDGGIQLEWHAGGLDVEFCFSDQEQGAFIRDRLDGAPAWTGGVEEGVERFLELRERLTAGAAQTE